MYIDPSSGGLIAQIALVIFGVFSGTVLMFSSKIKMTIAKWRRSMRKEENVEETKEQK